MYTSHTLQTENSLHCKTISLAITHTHVLQINTCGFCVAILIMLVSRCTNTSTRDLSSCSSSLEEPARDKEEYKHIKCTMRSSSHNCRSVAITHKNHSRLHVEVVIYSKNGHRRLEVSHHNIEGDS